MTSNRIWIDLSSFFSGVRQQSCIIVDHEKLKTVKDVEDHISRVFEIDSPFFILNDGWLLPSSESSLLFRDNDTVSVIPQTESKAIQKAAESAKQPSVKSSVGPINQPGSGDSLTNHIPKKIGKENGLSNGCEISCVSVKNPFAQPSAPVTSQLKANVEHSKAVDKINGHSLATATEEDSQDLELNSNHENESETKKRKRLRRRKRKSSQNIDELSKSKEVKQSRYVMNKIFQGVSHILNTSLAPEKNNQKHIFFQEDDVSGHQEVNAEVPSAAVAKEAVSTTPCQTTPVVETNLSKLFSLGHQKSPALFERKKPDIVNPTKKTPTAIPVSVKLTPLKEIPVKETVIKFKMLKMVNYCPTISEVITARVISPDFSSQKIYVQIQDGLTELESEKGKFSLDDDDDNPELPPNPYRLLDWHDLIEPMAVEY